MPMRQTCKSRFVCICPYWPSQSIHALTPIRLRTGIGGNLSASFHTSIASHRIAHAGNPPVLTSRPWCDCHSSPSPRSRTQDIENTHCPSSECVVEPFVLLLLLPSRHLQYPNYIPSLHSATASTTHSGQKHTGHHFHELNLLLLFLYPPTTPRYPSELYRASRLRLSLQFRHPGER